MKVVTKTVSYAAVNKDAKAKRAVVAGVVAGSLLARLKATA